MVNSPLAPSDEVMTLDCQRVMVLLPHRYPFLLVDRVIALVRGQSIHAVKNVSITEPFFQGHLPNRPVMPGDQMILKANLLRSLKGIWRFETRAEVDGCEVASAQMMISPEPRNR